MSHSKRNQLIVLMAALLLYGCDSPSETTTPQQSVQTPQPPYSLLISEDFEHEPQLSFFPRLGIYRPENDETEKLQYWNAYIKHIERTSGVVEGFGKDGGRILGLRSLKDASTVGMFAPFEVDPNVDYQISFDCRAELPDGARTGLRIYEFDTFLADGLQLSMAQLEEHLEDLKSETVLTGLVDWEKMTLNFTTGDQTRMVHLYFFREGTHDRLPVLIDNITIKKRD